MKHFACTDFMWMSFFQALQKEILKRINFKQNTAPVQASIQQHQLCCPPGCRTPSKLRKEHRPPAHGVPRYGTQKHPGLSPRNAQSDGTAAVTVASSLGCCWETSRTNKPRARARAQMPPAAKPLAPNPSQALEAAVNAAPAPAEPRRSAQVAEPPPSPAP